MKIQILSDLHFDFHRDGGKSFIEEIPMAADTLVLAGDLAESHNLIQKLELVCSKWKRVIFVAGNHDYYNTSLTAGTKMIKKNKPSNCLFLNNERKEIDGVGFYGGTMWFPYNPLNWDIENLISDFRSIRNFRDEYPVENKEFLHNCHNLVQDGDVIISHHLPHSNSVASKYLRYRTNAFFLCEAGIDIMDSKPKLWIHGHTHTRCDYRIGDTRVICNPVGYPGESNDYCSDLVIDI